jgi:hypothetical protein
MKTSETITKILGSLLKVKSEMGKVSKSANNPFFHSKYADLNTYLSVVEPLFEKHGLVMLQPSTENQVETVIFHAETGEWVSSSLNLVLVKNDMQSMGAAVTYARRFTLGSLLGMQTEDDDGNLASGKEVTSLGSSTVVANSTINVSANTPSVGSTNAVSVKASNTGSTGSGFAPKASKPLVPPSNLKTQPTPPVASNKATIKSGSWS